MDKSIINLIPPRISECALYLGVSAKTCMSGAVEQKVKEVTRSKTVEEAKKITSCDSERCVLTKLRPQLGNDVVNAELDMRFKVEGPRNSDWLTDSHIENIVKQWSVKWRNFFPYNFNMRNYASYKIDPVTMRVVNEPDTLATINFEDLYSRGFDCAACVCNTDTYQGRGKHWIVLFVDARKESPMMSAEIFDSAGNPPLPEWQSWLTKTKIQLDEIAEGKKPTSIIRAYNNRHQFSDSECGVYSLYYIWARLNGIAPEAFQDSAVADKKMFEFRQHLFYDKKWKDSGEFDWDEYQRQVKIDWVNRAVHN